MSPSMPRKAVPPVCTDCGASKPFAYRRPGFTDEEIASSGGLGCYDWLCGSCWYKREHPGIETGQDPVQILRHVLPVQNEKLFDVDA